MGAIHSLCTRSILLERGQVIADGAVDQVVQRYREVLLGPDGSADLSVTHGRPGSGTVRLVGFRLQDLDGNTVTTASAGRGVRIVFDYENSLGEPPHDVQLTAVFVGSRDIRLFGTPSEVVRADLSALRKTGQFVCVIPRLPLLPGTYDLVVSCLVDRQLTDKLEKICSIAVTDSDYFGTGRLPANNFGDVFTDYHWSLEPSK
jgi:lipopolysaccharide transport system ATP-binding protein